MSGAPVEIGDPLAHVLGVRTATLLGREFGMRTVGDVLRHLPFRYRRKGVLLGGGEAVEGDEVVMVGTVVSVDRREGRGRNGPRTFHVVGVSDGRDQVSATFFNLRYIPRIMPVGTRVMLEGKLSFYKERMQLTHPAFMVLHPDMDEGIAEGEAPRAGGAFLAMLKAAAGDDAVVFSQLLDRELLPVYRGTSAVDTWKLLVWVTSVLNRMIPPEDPLPRAIRDREGLVDLDDALRRIHLPDDDADVEKARARLRFDEAFSLQLALARRRARDSSRRAPACAPRGDGLAAAFDARLPFTLTSGQVTVGEEIARDLAGETPMSRLLQGEVGSGKTIVAVRAMLQVIDAGRQCVLLAPTEVLATQHARSVAAMLGPLARAGELGAADTATRVTLLTGSMSVPDKRRALLDIVSGESGIVIGTHALIQDNVEFLDLGLVVVDEQHRFGVRQRDHLREKGRGGAVPHFLVMTATPIPRTIAMTVFGDLDTSVLRELPAGRGSTRTTVVHESRTRWVERMWERIGEEVAAGRQAYVVCPRIDDDSAGGETRLHAATATHARLAAEVFPDLTVGLLHGRMSTEEKDATMTAFAAGGIDVLVCTTVIEVGVDVPNATVMVVLDADRFGVSQLHQLRGRIGRGGHDGLCLLVTSASEDGKPVERLEGVAATTDGFELARLDLATRKEGDVLGDAQSGNTRSLRLVRLLDHEELIVRAKRIAAESVAGDPELGRSPGLRHMADVAEGATDVEYLGRV